jgi:serine/threonine protein kinase
MARVFKAWDNTLDRAVAVKVMHAHLAEDPTFKERFEQEAKFIASVDHPNIVHVYDYNTLEVNGERIHYMVMPFISGPNLQDVLEAANEREELLPNERVQQIMLNVVDGIGYAHDHGLIHRDVKPANILLNERGEAVLTDFGIARLVQSSGLTQEGITVGTPAYMSPEQATGEVVDARSDLYALGVILYEMLTGEPPFGNDGSLSVLLKHLNEEIPSLSKHLHVSQPYLDRVILKAMAKNREDRYQTAKEFGEDLKMAFEGQMPDVDIQRVTRRLPTAAIAQAPSEVSRQTLRSPLGILAIGLLVIVGLLVVGLIGSMADDDNDPPATEVAELGDQDDLGVEGMTGALYFSSDFSESDPYATYWPQDELNMISRRITSDGLYRIDSEMEGRAVATIFEEGSEYHDFTLEMTGLLDESSSPTSGYGIIFRYVDDENYNVFAVDGLGRFSIWVREAGTWRELRGEADNWTLDDTVLPIGEMNTLTVEVTGSQIYGYVNGTRVASVMDDTIPTGGIGIYLASPQNGRTGVVVDTFEVTESEISSADSMTGDEPMPTATGSGG